MHQQNVISLIYQHYIPVKLKGIVDIIWMQKADSPARWKILPSGKVELIFRLSPPGRMLSARKIDERNSPLRNFCFLSGLHTRPLSLSFEQFHHIGLQMKPIAVKALFGIPSCEVRDYYLEGNSIFKSLGQIEDTLNSNRTFVDKAKWLEKFVLSRIVESPDLYLAIDIHKTIHKITIPTMNRRNKPIEQLLGYSRTQTFRIFKDWFGLSSHSYQRLIQFVQSVHCIHNMSGNLTATAMYNNYFDQAHFIRSFKEFAEMTPGEYKRYKSSLAGQLPF